MYTYVRTSLYSTCVYVHVHKCALELSIQYIYMCSALSVQYICAVCMYLCVCVCARACVCVCARACVCVCARARVCVCLDTYLN